MGQCQEAISAIGRSRHAISKQNLSLTVHLTEARSHGVCVVVVVGGAVTGTVLYSIAMCPHQSYSTSRRPGSGLDFELMYRVDSCHDVLINVCDPVVQSADTCFFLLCCTRQDANLSISDALQEVKKGRSWGYLHFDEDFSSAFVERYLKSRSATPAVRV